MSIQDPLALLRTLCQQAGESPWLEFKVNNKDPELIGRSVCAGANAAMMTEKERAYIVFGVEDGTRKLIGTTVRLNALRVGGENFHNWLTRMIEPRLVIDFAEFDEDDLHFAIITVSPSYDRPVRFAGTEYIRIGENLKPLRDHPEHERSLWMASARQKFEGAVALSHQSAAAVLEILDVDALYALLAEPKPDSDKTILQKLIRLELIREDMEGGYDITNLGALCIARDLQQFPSLAGKPVRVVRYVGKDKRRSDSEIVGTKGYASGFAGLVRFMARNTPTEERYVNGVRRNVPVYSQTAIREFVANALIHQDFTITGAGPVIEIYDDRIEISNPGQSLIDVDRLVDERRSRNEKLASRMRDLGICEERGGGIDKAILEIEEMSLPAPLFIPSKDSMRVVMFGPRPFNKLSKSDRIWACYLHCVVRCLQHDYMSNTSLRERFRLPSDEYQAVSAVISDARKQGKIVPADENQGKRNARYLPYWMKP